MLNSILEKSEITESHHLWESIFSNGSVKEYNNLQSAAKKMLLLYKLLNKVNNIYGDGENVYYPFRFDALLILITHLKENKKLYDESLQHMNIRTAMQNKINSGDDSDITKAELYACQFRLGSIYSLYNNYDKFKIFKIIEDKKCLRTVIARKKISAGEIITIYDLSALLCSDRLFPASIDHDKLTEISESPVLKEYQADITPSIIGYGNFYSSYFGCGQFINDMSLSSRFLKYCDTQERYIPKYTIKDWKDAIDSNNKDKAIETLSFLKALNKSYAERYNSSDCRSKHLKAGNNVKTHLHDSGGCKQLQIIAKTEIKENEELSIAYGVHYWLSWDACDLKILGLENLLDNKVNWIEYMFAETDKLLSRNSHSNSLR